MGFRLRRSARLGLLRFSSAKVGWRSISVSWRGASFNIHVARSGGPPTSASGAG
jgi:hypothetical protein